MSTEAEQPSASDLETSIRFNAWRPHVSLERRTVERGVHVSASRRQPAASSSSTSNSSGGLPRTAASDSASSLYGFIASDDGGSSVFSDSSDIEANARTSLKNRRLPSAERCSSRVPAQRRPHTSSGLVGEGKNASRYLRLFEEHTSSARALSTAELLRTLGDKQPNVKPLQV
jgi:hypothetical protein